MNKGISYKNQSGFHAAVELNNKLSFNMLAYGSYTDTSME
jgi:hypothetical protein